MTSMFRRCILISKSRYSKWNVSNVTDMSSNLNDASSFNKDISIGMYQVLQIWNLCLINIGI